MKLSALVLLLGLSLLGASADLRLMVVLLHEERLPSDDWGQVPHQVGWILWRAPHPVVAFATGESQTVDSELLSVALSDATVEGSRAQQVFARRNGVRPPANRLLALSAGRLREQGLLQRTLASRLSPDRQRGVYVRVPQSPAPSPYALLSIGAQGFVPIRTYSDLEEMRVELFQSDYAWALLELTRWDYLGLELLVAEGVETWVICLPPDGKPHRTQLTTVVRYSAREPKGLLTSPSTRWTGLVQEVDVVPTLMRALSGEWDSAVEGAPIVESGQFDWHRFWNGLLPRTLLRGATASVGIDIPRDALSRIRMHWAVQREFAPVVLGWIAVGALGWTFAGLLLYRLRWLPRRLRRIYVGGLAVFALFPVVALWYAYCPYDLWTGNRKNDLSLLVSWLMLGWLHSALVMGGIARLTGTPPLWSSALVVLGVYLAELFVAGGYGLNRSLTHFALQPNARPYGMDYFDLGVLMGCALLVPAIWMEHRGKARLGGRGQVSLGLLYGLLVAGSGLSLFGALAQAIFPLTLALGLMALYSVGAQSEGFRGRALLPPVVALVGVAGALTVGAILIDQTQPWQRQTNLSGTLWLSDWQGIPWRLPEPMMVLVVWLGLWLGLRFWERFMAPIWEHAPALRWAMVAGGLGGVMPVFFSPRGWLTLGAVAFYLLAMAIEYRVGTVEFGYRHEGNGVAKSPKITR
ncbi:MAG: hypothetical protein SNJ72_03385 [Fimbriimonadales bacterium]